MAHRQPPSAVDKSSPSNKREHFFYKISGERARELLFLYGEKGHFLVRPSESNPNDHTLTVQYDRGNRVTHVKLPFDAKRGVYHLPSGHEFGSLPPLVEHLLRTPNSLAERDGSFIELSRPCPIPHSEEVINIGRDRYFHMQISGIEAEELLRDESAETYLVRESTSTPGEFALSVKAEGGNCLHVKVYHEAGRFRIVPKDSFSSLSDLLEHYVRTPMVQNGGTAVRLKAPLFSTRFTAATIDQRVESLTRLSKKAPSNAKDGIAEEYERINNDKETLMFVSCKEGRRPANVRKNRYRNVVPFDHTRIKLRLSSSCESHDGAAEPSTSDYINANWVEVASPASMENGSSGSSGGNASKEWTEYGDFNRRYISTQGPLEETLGDFWRMVWQEGCRLLVALTREVERGRVKCARYWPEHVGEEVEFESAGERFVVKWVREEEVGVDYATRELWLTKSGKADEGGTAVNGAAEEHRSIYHQQFLAWEDNCCPSDSVLLFLDDVNRKLDEFASEAGSSRDASLEALGPLLPSSTAQPPVVVHCSAGIGRTGTFIVLDILLNRIKAVGPQCIIDIPKTVRMLREQRATMVQTDAQYRFIYQAISAYMRIRREHVQNGVGLDEGSSHNSASPQQPSLEKLNIAG